MIFYSAAKSLSVIVLGAPLKKLHKDEVISLSSRYNPVNMSVTAILQSTQVNNLEVSASISGLIELSTAMKRICKHSDHQSFLVTTPSSFIKKQKASPDTCLLAEPDSIFLVLS